MGNRLFVGGLSWGTDDRGLISAFEQFGNIVDSKVITDRETGKSRGFGFVTYDAEASAQQAIQQMNGMMLDGRTITVNEAQERPRGGGGGGRPRSSNGGGGGRSYPEVEKRSSSGRSYPEVEHRSGGGGGRGDDRGRSKGRRRRDSYEDSW